MFKFFGFQHFAHNKKSGSVGSFDLNKGTNRFCLAQPGVYKLRPDSCHKFEKEEYIYDTYVCSQSVNKQREVRSKQFCKQFDIGSCCTYMYQYILVSLPLIHFTITDSLLFCILFIWVFIIGPFLLYIAIISWITISTLGPWNFVFFIFLQDFYYL